MSALPGTVGSSRTGRRVRAKLILVFVLTAIVVTAVTAGVLTRIVTVSFEREYRSTLERKIAAVDLVLEQRGRRVSSALRRLEVLLAGPELPRLQRLLGGGPAVVDEAAHLAALVGLDRLTILDGEGTVVSSLNWPERAGLPDEAARRFEPDRLVLRWVADPGGEGLALVTARRLEAGRRALILVGGSTLEQDFLEEAAAGHPAWLFVPGRQSVASFSTGNATIDPGTLGRIARGEGDAVETDVPGDGDGGRWSVGRRELRDDAAQTVGAVLLAVSRTGLDVLQRRLLTAFLVLGLLSAILAAVVALWVSSRISRPVVRLVRAVDAIASGRADYTFPRRAEDELEALEEAFSRLQRSLETQRNRSVAAERVAAWREVARHVAHEVKNPLAPIRLTVENLIRARRKQPGMFDELFEEGSRTILEEVEQLRRLVSEFSEFARLPAPKPTRTDLHGLVDDVLNLYGSENWMEVERSYASGSPSVEVDSEQMNRALKNVVGNAVEAMRDHPPRGNRHRLAVRTAIEDDRVAVEIADSGPGIPPSVAGRIFEPYFTTKREGTGLGMAIAYRIVTEHGGWIAAENREEGGARILIHLPLAAPSRPERTRPETDSEAEA